MLRKHNGELLLDRLDHERTNITHGGTLIDITVLDIVSGGTSWADQLLADQSSCGQWGVVKTAEGSCAEILIVVLQNDDLVSRVEKLIVEWVTY